MSSEHLSLVLSTSPLLVGAGDAARLLGIGRTLFLQMDNSGRLGPMGLNFGKRRLWSIEELRMWVQVGTPIRERWERMKMRESTENIRL